MRVLILCGGLGTRLREETEFKPKPLVEIGGRPILWHLMKGFAQHGFSHFVLALGYKGNLIKQYFLDYQAMNSSFTVQLGRPAELEFHAEAASENWTVTLADTGFKTQTGGRIARASRHLGSGRFFLTYGDGVSDVDLGALVRFHQSHGKLVTVTGVHPPSRYGELRADGDSVVRFAEKPAETDAFVSGGFFVCEPGMLDYLSSADLNSADDLIFERGPLEQLAKDGQLRIYRHDGFWGCMDTIRDFQFLNEQWESGRAPWKTWSD